MLHGDRPELVLVKELCFLTLAVWGGLIVIVIKIVLGSEIGRLLLEEGLQNVGVLVLDDVDQVRYLLFHLVLVSFVKFDLLGRLNRDVFALLLR